MSDTRAAIQIKFRSTNWRASCLRTLPFVLAGRRRGQHRLAAKARHWTAGSSSSAPGPGISHVVGTGNSAEQHHFVASGIERHRRGVACRRRKLAGQLNPLRRRGKLPTTVWGAFITRQSRADPAQAPSSIETGILGWRRYAHVDEKCPSRNRVRRSGRHRARVPGQGRGGQQVLRFERPVIDCATPESVTVWEIAPASDHEANASCVPAAVACGVVVDRVYVPGGGAMV